ncbi:MAG: response regulator [Betaproteobacteria bacterium]|nr:response regulator [Betaproteobacteria bacterium]
MRILLVEDDPQIGRGAQVGLNQLGYAVDWVQTGSAARTAVSTHDYAAVLLDLGLPDMDGLAVLKELRSRGYTNPVLIVTARAQTADRIVGLDAGADDFIVKPFDLDEVAARIRAATRRTTGRAKSTLQFRNVELNPANRSVTVAGVLVQLTAREFALLADLIEHAGQVMTREQLEASLYGWGDEIESNTVQVHIHHLRRKLGKEIIQTIHGIGYVVAKE